MKKINIKEGKIGLVFKNESLKRILKEGSYWISLFSNVEIYDLQQNFYTKYDLNLLLKHESFRAVIDLIEVQDEELALRYENGLFQEVLTPGRHVFWKGLNNQSFLKVDLSKIEITENISRNTFLKPEMFKYIRSYKIESYEKGLLYVDGLLKQELEPGIYAFWQNAINIEVQKVDLRQTKLEIFGQEILTLDKAALRINFDLSYRVLNVSKALSKNKDFERQLYILMQLALREYIGALTFDELLEQKMNLNEIILGKTFSKVQKLGVEVSECGIKDIILPGEVKEIMNQVLVAQKKAQANVITRREETASTRSMLNTAKLMDENPMLFKMKEMEYVEKISERINNITLSGGGKVIGQLKEIFT